MFYYISQAVDSRINGFSSFNNSSHRRDSAWAPSTTGEWIAIRLNKVWLYGRIQRICKHWAEVEDKRNKDGKLLDLQPTEGNSDLHVVLSVIVLNVSLFK